MSRNSVDALINTPDAFNFSKENEEIFFRAMQEAFAHHYHRCSVYSELCKRAGFVPDDFREYWQFVHIPYIFVSVFKQRKLQSSPPEEIKVVLTSSGTTGEKSAIYLDSASLRRIKRIVWNIYAAFGMANKKEMVNYLCFTYDPAFARDLGTAFSDKLLSRLTGVNNIFYSIRFDRKRGDFALDREGCLRVLERYAAEGLPVRLLGFPSFLYEVLKEYYGKRRGRLRFGARSFVITGGGWKTLGDKEIPKAEFKARMGEWLGIPPENVRDLFGMVEHGVPYCECEEGSLHVPIYSRALVRDPGNLEILPDGEVGIFHLFTPYLRSFPAISLLTSDLGRIGRDCPCGRNAPYIEILGRGGIRKHRGCAIAALDILKK